MNLLFLGSWGDIDQSLGSKELGKILGKHRVRGLQLVFLRGLELKKVEDILIKGEELLASQHPPTYGVCAGGMDWIVFHTSAERLDPSKGSVLRSSPRFRQDSQIQYIDSPSFL